MGGVGAALGWGSEGWDGGGMGVGWGGRVTFIRRLVLRQACSFRELFYFGELESPGKRMWGFWHSC